MNAIETREPAQIGHGTKIGHRTKNVTSPGNRTRDPSHTRRSIYPVSHGLFTCTCIIQGTYKPCKYTKDNLQTLPKDRQSHMGLTGILFRENPTLQKFPLISWLSISLCGHKTYLIKADVSTIDWYNIYLELQNISNSYKENINSNNNKQF